MVEKDLEVEVTYLKDHKVQRGVATVKVRGPYVYIKHPKFGTCERHFYHQDLPGWAQSFIFMNGISLYS